MPKKLEHQLSQISECRDIKTTERFITGAASPGGDAIALLDDKGRLILLRLEPNSRNRMSTARPPLQLEARLVSQEKASQASLRFCHKDGALYFFAVDTQGTVIRKRIEGASTAPLQPPQQAPAELAALLPAPVVQEASSVQASDGSRGSTSRHSHSGNSAVIELPPSPSQPQANPPQIQFQNPFPGRISFP